MLGMRAVASAVWMVALMLPGLARGADAQLSVSGAVEYDNNVARSEANTENDVVLRVVPHIRVLEDNGPVTWKVYYQPAYSYAATTGVIDNFTHFANASGKWQISERTQVFASDNFSYSDAINSLTTIGENDEALISTDTASVIRNAATAGLSHDFTERLRGRVSVNQRLFNSDLNNRSDVQTYGGTVDLSYMFSPKHRFGGGVATTYQNFDASPNGRVPESDALFVNFFGSWTWFIDETTSFEITAGPTFVDSQQPTPPLTETLPTIAPFVVSPGDPTGNTLIAADIADCTPPDAAGDVLFVSPSSCVYSITVDDPAAVAALRAESAPLTLANPVEVDSTSWTIFAQAELTKRWTQDIISTLAYTRRDSSASGVAGSTVLDFLRFNTTWRISQLWDTAVGADFALRKSTSPQTQVFPNLVQGPTMMLPGSGQEVAQFGGLVQTVTRRAVDTQRYGAAWRLTRRLTKNLSVSTRYTFVKQNSKSRTVAGFSDFTDHLVTLRIQYDFDRWTLW